MNQLFHVLLHVDAIRRRDFMIVDNHRARIFAQPIDALLNDAIRLAHFFNTHQITIVAIAIDADRNIKVHLIINFVRLLFAQIPLNTGATQHRAGEAQRLRTLRRHNADTDSALFPNAVVGKQGFIFIDVASGNAW